MLLEGAHHGRRRRRRRGPAGHRRATTGWPRPAPATCSPASIAALLAAGLGAARRCGGRRPPPRRGRPALPRHRHRGHRRRSTPSPARSPRVGRRSDRWPPRSRTSTSTPSPTTSARSPPWPAPPRSCAVVKADGYGHGSVAVGPGRARRRRHLAGRRPGRRGPGAAGRRHRGADPAAQRAPTPDEIDAALALGLRLVVYRRRDDRCHRRSGRRPSGVPDVAGPPQGRHRDAPGRLRTRRRGRRSPAASPATPALRLEGTMTHLAMADEPDDPHHRPPARPVRRRARRPGRRRHRSRASATPPTRPAHDRLPPRPARPRPGRASRSTASRRRPALAGAVDLRPALRWTSTGVDGEAGRARASGSPTATATPSSATPSWPPCRSATPTASAAGSAWSAARCSIGGRRRPIVGVVTMDQLMVDCGPDADVARGRRGRAARAAGRRVRSRPTTGPTASTPSATRSCAGSRARVPRTR